MAHLRPSVTSVTFATLVIGFAAGCGTTSSVAESTGVGVAVSEASSAADGSAAATPVKRGEMCGETRGPDGKLFVHKLGDATVECDEAMRIAQAFGPQIASAKPATVEGWKCTLPSTPGMLARCDSGAKAIGFFSSH